MRSENLLMLRVPSAAERWQRLLSGEEDFEEDFDEEGWEEDFEDEE